MVNELSRCEQLFLARWLQLLYDEMHPRWSIRPLSVSNLSSLYPPTFDSRKKELIFATEDELLRRVVGAEPDAKPFTHPNQHSSDFRGRRQCTTCQGILSSSSSGSLQRSADLVERLISSIDTGDERNVLVLTPVVASEAVAARVPLRFILQTSRNYILKAEAGSFRDRLYDFLRHDVAQQPRESPGKPRGKCSVRREIRLEAAAAKRIPSCMGSEAIGLLELERDRLWLSRANVEDRLNRREDTAVALRTLTPGWLAVLRFCFPDVTVLPGSSLEVRPKPPGKPIECPGHRRVFSRAQVERAFPPLEYLIANDEVRASLYWLSLAYQVWGESVAHAAGMVWMSIESLVGDEGLARCADAYVDRLQSQLADDIDETLGTLARDSGKQRKGHLAAGWVRKLPKRHLASNDQAWLAELNMAAGRVCEDPALCFVISDAANLAGAAAREGALAQTLIDLRMLRATRHAVAHRGKSIAEEPLLHYLATLGCECIRALLAERLDRTPHEGTLEGRPILRAECEEVNDHWHIFNIPAWTSESSDLAYTSAFSEWETLHERVATEDAWRRLTEFTGHRHSLTLTTEHRAKLTAGEYVKVMSSVTEGHSHNVLLFLI
jgi:hypothetical protein